MTHSLLRRMSPKLWLPPAITQPVRDGVNSITLWRGHDVALVPMRRCDQHDPPKLQISPDLGDR